MKLCVALSITFNFYLKNKNCDAAGRLGEKIFIKMAIAVIRPFLVSEQSVMSITSKFGA